MKTHLIGLIALSAMAVAPAFAQQDTKARDYDTPKGELTVTYGQPELARAGSPPDFASLDRDGNGSIDMEEAHSGYYLLYNDFIHADLNRDKRISAREYQVWLKEPVR